MDMDRDQLRDFLRTVPWRDYVAVYWERVREKNSPGRRVKFEPCPVCGRKLTARERRKHRANNCPYKQNDGA